MGWTRIADDTGGGHSMSGHEILYFEGSELDAKMCLHALGQDPDASSEEYGSCFGSSHAASFAQVSWFERGCDLDRSTRQAIESARSEWETHVSVLAHRSACRTDLAQAVEQAKSHSSDRSQRWLLCPRMETLALMFSARGSIDSALLGGIFREFMDLAAPGIPRGANQGFIAKAFAHGLALCGQVGIARSQGDMEAPEAWDQACGHVRWIHLRALLDASDPKDERPWQLMAKLMAFPFSVEQGADLAAQMDDRAAQGLISWLRQPDAELSTRRIERHAEWLIALCEAKLIGHAAAGVPQGPQGPRL